MEKNNPYEYSFEFFLVQVAFARCWVEITGEDYSETLLNKTSLYRRVTMSWYKKGDEYDSRWLEVISFTGSDAEIAERIYELYKQQKHADYEKSKALRLLESNNFFELVFVSREDDPDDIPTFRTHSRNILRGEHSFLSPVYADKRFTDFQDLFRRAKEAHPEARRVVGISWLYNLKSYCDTFPSEYTANLRRLIPMGYEDEFIHEEYALGLQFIGGDIWGQFQNRFGFANLERCNKFLSNLGRVQTIRDLLDAFPLYAYQAEAPVEVFYDFFRVNEIRV